MNIHPTHSDSRSKRIYILRNSTNGTPYWPNTERTCRKLSLLLPPTFNIKKRKKKDSRILSKSRASMCPFYREFLAFSDAF